MKRASSTAKPIHHARPAAARGTRSTPAVFLTVEEAVRRIGAGKMIIVVDLEG